MHFITVLPYIVLVFQNGLRGTPLVPLILVLGDGFTLYRMAVVAIYTSLPGKLSVHCRTAAQRPLSGGGKRNTKGMDNPWPLLQDLLRITSPLSCWIQVTPDFHGGCVPCHHGRWCSMLKPALPCSAPFSGHFQVAAMHM